MALFGRKAKAQEAAVSRTPATLLLVEARRELERDGGSGLLDALITSAVDATGTAYDFVVDVQVAGSAPYRVGHRERVPLSATRAKLIGGDEKIPDGITLPGWVDPADPQTIRIDWSAFNASPESTAEVANAEQYEQDRNYAEHALPRMPAKQQQMLRDSALQGAMLLAPMVKAGQVSREQFEQEAGMNLRRTLLTQEQYDAAVAIIES